MSAIKTWDHLGACHKSYPHKLCLEYFQEGQGFGTLTDSTFGPRLDVIKPYIERAGLLRFHLLNNTAVRNKKNLRTELLYPYGNAGQASLDAIDADARRPGSRLYTLIGQQIDRFEPLIKDFKGIVLVSALIEHNLSAEGAAKVTDYIRGRGHAAVDNPMIRNYPKITYAQYESHGNNKKGLDIVSHDGISAFDANYIYKDSNSTPYQMSAEEVEAYWIDTFNGRFSGQKEWINPRDRKTWPTAYELQLVEQQMKATPPVPKVSGYKLLQAPNIWKPAAEDYKKPGDARQGLPCFICTVRAPRATIKTLEGKKIKDMPYYGTIDSRFRYYLGGTGMNHFTVFNANNKREWVLLDIGNQKFLVNLFRRLGVER